MYTTYRLFPTAPIFDFLDNVPPLVHTSLFVLSVFLTIAAFLNTKNKCLLIGLLVTDLLLCVLDQNRWQPWEYQYLLVIFIFIINTHRQNIIPIAISFLLAFTYIYSGLSKLNEGFLHEIWINVLLKHFFRLPAWVTAKHWVYFSGYILGIVELLAGIGLLFKRTQKICAMALVLMHLFILLVFGPLGLTYNKIVWPWNVAMILYLYFVFIRRNSQVVGFRQLNVGWNRLVILCWGILPAFNFIGYWDNYLSMNLYSGNTPKMSVCVGDTSGCKQLIKYVHKVNKPRICAEAMISIQYWSLTETNVPVYPERRVYKTIGRKLTKQYPFAKLSYTY
jgi:hypothetical protein